MRIRNMLIGSAPKNYLLVFVVHENERHKNVLLLICSKIN